MIDQPDDRSRESSRRILQIAEREVGRIILDIHDGPVQNIFAALSQMYIVQRRLGRHLGDGFADEIERLGRSVGLLEHALNDIRTFMGAFRPPEFERRDLILVLEGLAIQHEALTGSTVVFDVDGDLPEVSLPVKIGLYRILQEALSNSTRHGKADHHFVTLYSDGKDIVMEVTDEGIGFDLATVLNGLEGIHIGLEGMRERVGILGGSFHIQSAPGNGTQVRVVVPCQ
ncbi:MAG: ATP-binding protein [Chloroflexales bacterium]|nr:ATP-binding protein [Chloroflexales bacterium]